MKYDLKVNSKLYISAITNLKTYHDNLIEELEVTDNEAVGDYLESHCDYIKTIIETLEYSLEGFNKKESMH